MDEGWDGKMNGVDCGTGSYFYKANYANKKGIERSKQGSITILR
jgi:hypothetical protein